MGFLDSYKHLEKLCGDMFHDNRRISAYIEAMQDTPNGSFYVKSWNDDLKMLKHYRWIRNQISHEPGCSEDTMCTPNDTIWIDDFYNRIIHQTDPLALYRKATSVPKSTRPLSSAPQNGVSFPRSEKSHLPVQRNSGKYVLPALFLILALIILIYFIVRH